MAKEKEGTGYGDTLVALDQGDTSSDIRIEPADSPEQPSEQGATVEAEQAPEVAEEQAEEEEYNKEGAAENFRKLSSERDTYKQRFESKEKELDDFKRLTAMTVEQAELARQAQPPKPQGPPPEYNELEANTPGTASYNWLEGQRMQTMRQLVREEMQQGRQQAMVEAQIAALKQKHPEATDEMISQLAAEYRKPGAITYEMLWGFKHGAAVQAEAVQEAKKEGIETVNRQVAKASRPSIAQSPGETKPPIKQTAQEKEEQAHWDRIEELDAQYRDASHLGLPIAEK